MERDELIAFAENKGLKVDRRLGDEKLRESIEAQLDDGPVSRDWGGEPPEPDVPPVVDAPVDEPPEVLAEPSPEVGPEPTWPKRVAPRVWLDQQGRRYTDLNQALAGAAECARRG